MLTYKTAYQHFKTLLIFGFFIIATFTFPRVSFAQNCNNVNYDDPSIVQIVCPFIGVINMIILSAGAVFVAIVIFASYKYSTSLGDPKGAMGAKNTLTYAILGLVAVIGVYTMFSIMASAFGFDSQLVGGRVFGLIQQRFCDFLTGGTVSGGPIVGGPAGCN